MTRQGDELLAHARVTPISVTDRLAAAAACERFKLAPKTKLMYVYARPPARTHGIHFHLFLCVVKILIIVCFDVVVTFGQAFAGGGGVHAILLL